MPQRWFHVTSSLNRQSIQEHGLDWTRMRFAHGVAGVAGTAPVPEVDGIFLSDDEWDVDYFAEMAVSQGHPALDVWAVDLPDGTELTEHDNGYSYLPAKVPPEELHLIRSDWTPRSRFDA